MSLVSALLAGLLAMVLAACDPGNSPRQTVDYPEMDSPAFQNYQAQCSECHVPPRTTAHTAPEWPSVIARMQQHRVQRRIAPMMAADMTVVRDYLVRNAATAEGS
ncbi:MAG: hypothetical protein Q9M08_08090 [Mariprofundus sp.]|nr:hypothetical protein [Mariprofundus sp.]